MQLTATEWEILHATAGAAEDLESIYQAVHDSPRPARLAEVADAVRGLVEKGVLAAQAPGGGAPSAPEDASYVWKSRFALTPQGQDVRAAAGPIEGDPRRPSLFGAWREHRIKLSSADLDEARREMWADFPRDAPR